MSVVTVRPLSKANMDVCINVFQKPQSLLTQTNTQSWSSQTKMGFPKEYVFRAYKMQHKCGHHMYIYQKLWSLKSKTYYCGCSLIAATWCISHTYLHSPKEVKIHCFCSAA